MIVLTATSAVLHQASIRSVVRLTDPRERVPLDGLVTGVISLSTAASCGIELQLELQLGWNPASAGFFRVGRKLHNAGVSVCPGVESGVPGLSGLVDVLSRRCRSLAAFARAEARAACAYGPVRE
jgi:hypothetical protein